MVVSKQCVTLAAALSASYGSQMFHNYNASYMTLKDPFHNTGIQLTMCARDFYCGPSFTKQYLQRSGEDAAPLTWNSLAWWIRSSPNWRETGFDYVIAGELWGCKKSLCMPVTHTFIVSSCWSSLWQAFSYFGGDFWFAIFIFGKLHGAFELYFIPQIMSSHNIQEGGVHVKEFQGVSLLVFSENGC